MIYMYMYISTYSKYYSTLDIIMYMTVFQWTHFSHSQKEWREDYHGAFKKKVFRCVRRSQEEADDEH